MDRRKFIKTLGKAGLAVVASAIPGCENNYDNLEFIITDHSPAVKNQLQKKQKNQKNQRKNQKKQRIKKTPTNQK